MLLINFEINLILTWSQDCRISSATVETKFKITDTKLYVPVVTLSIQDNAKLLQQLDFLLDPSFQGVNKLFVLSFKNEGDRKVHTGYYLPKVEIKDDRNKMIAINLSKRQKLDSDLKAIQQINFNGNLENQSTIFFIIEEAIETDFFQGTVKVFNFIFSFNIKWLNITL